MQWVVILAIGELAVFDYPISQNLRWMSNFLFFFLIPKVSEALEVGKEPVCQK